MNLTEEKKELEDLNGGVLKTVEDTLPGAGTKIVSSVGTSAPKKENTPVVAGNPAADFIGTGGSNKGSLNFDTLKEKMKDSNESDFAVRDYMENHMGVDSDALNYKDGYITLDGNPLMKPGRLTDGTSYVKSEQELYDAVNEYAKQNGVVAVRDYVNSKGIPYDVGWNEKDGTVSINGVSFKPTFIIGGKAYLYQSELDRILGKASNGIKTDTDILNESKAKYGVDEAFDNYVNFRYDPNEDQAYRAFMDIYNRAISDEYKKNMAQAKFRTGGLAAPAVMQAASSIRERAMDDSAGYIQQFEDRARSLEKDKLSAIVSQMMNDYSLGSQANANDLNSYYKNLDQRMKDEEFWRKLRETDYNWELAAPYLPQLYADEAALSGLGVAAQQIANDTAGFNYDILGSNAKYADLFNEANLESLKLGNAGAQIANEGAGLNNEILREELKYLPSQYKMALYNDLLSGKITAKENGYTYDSVIEDAIKSFLGI